MANPLEINIMCCFRHPNLIHADGVYSHRICEDIIKPDHIGLMMPYAPYSLYGILPHSGRPKTFDTRKVMFQLADALRFLHENHLLHLDIKPENILIMGDGTPKLADFGLARYANDVHVGFEDEINSFVTYCYRAPEHFVSMTNWSAATDIWSLGMVFLEILLGSSIYIIAGEVREGRWLDFLQRGLRDDWSFYEEKIRKKYGNNNDLIALIRGMLSFERKLRWTLPQILSSPLFHGLVSVPGEYVLPPRMEGKKLSNAQTKYMHQLLAHRQMSHPLIIFFHELDLMMRSWSFQQASWKPNFIAASHVLCTLFNNPYYTIPDGQDVSELIELIVRLGGVLYPPYIFAAAQSYEQLMNVVDDLPSILENYQQLDLDRLFTETFPLPTQPTTKYIDISKDFYESLPLTKV